MPTTQRPLRFDAVLFDATGTLFHPHPSVGGVYARVAAEWGMQATPEALDAGFRAAWQERAASRFASDFARRTSEAAERLWWRGTVGRTFEHAGLPAPDDRLFEAIFERFADSACWRLFPDVVPALAALRDAGLTLGIVSNFDSRLDPLCRGLGLAQLVDFVLASASVGHAKPAPQFFEAAIHKAGVAAERILVVGDSPEEDVAGAQAAGCHALLLDRKAERHGTGVIHSLAELQLRGPLL